MKQNNIGNDVRIKLSFSGDIVYNLDNIECVFGYFINTTSIDDCNSCLHGCGTNKYHVLPFDKKPVEYFKYKADCQIIDDNTGVYAYFPGGVQVCGKYDFVLYALAKDDSWNKDGKRTYSTRYYDVLEIVCCDESIPDDDDNNHGSNCTCQLTEVVSSLPEENIKKNTIYLIKSSDPGEQNMFTEYVYTGDVNDVYDASKWEIVGSKSQDDINLDDYLKRDDNATYDSSGSMSAQDKKNLDQLLKDIYKFSIQSFSLSPTLVEVGSVVTANMSWSYQNEDQYPLLTQSLNGNVLQVTDRKYSEQQSSDTHKQVAYKLSAITQSGQTVSSTKYLTFNHRSYIGSIADGKTTIEDSDLEKMESMLQAGKQVTRKLAQDNQKLVYVYPTYFGELSSIKNSSGFEGLNGYSKSVISINEQEYYLYIQQIAATATDTYTFS